MYDKVLPDFKLCPDGLFSHRALNYKLETYHQLIRFIADLPYGRIVDSEDLMGVFEEHRGTCSTKHALLKSVADENDYSNIQLVIGIYNMDQYNTPGIGNSLLPCGLHYIPEAHCYLRYQNVRSDVTTDRSNIASFAEAIQEEFIITPDQITSHKVELHKSYLDKWRVDAGIDKSLQELWSIRELCIERLTTK